MVECKWTFVAAGVSTFETVVRSVLYEFIYWANDSENEIILVL